MIADAREKAHETALRIKLALIANDPAKYIHLLEEQVTMEPAKTTEVKATEADLDNTEGTWRFEHMDPTDAENVLAMLAAGGGGSLSAADVDGEWK